jgi:hypothetical protein
MNIQGVDAAPPQIRVSHEILRGRVKNHDTCGLKRKKVDTILK